MPMNKMRTCCRYLLLVAFVAIPAVLSAADCNLNGVPDEADVGDSLIVASMGTNSVMRFEATTGLFLDEMVSAASGGLQAPRGMKVGPDGNLYISSSRTDEVLRYNAETGEFIDVFVPTNSGGLDWPHAMIFDANGDMLLSSRNTNSVLHFSGQTGEYLGEFVSSRSGGLALPHGLAFGSDGHLYVVSRGSDQVLRYDGNSGAFIDVFVDRGILTNPIDMEFGPDGHLYVSGRENNAVLRFDGATGIFIDVFASAGGLDRPTGFSFYDATGDLYVSSFVTNQVLRYDGGSGAFNSVFTEGNGLSNPGFIYFSRPHANDCNTNAIPDSCDIGDGTSIDIDGNGVPDECEGIPPTPSDEQILMTFSRPTMIPGLGVVQGEDIVAYDPGTDTWTLLFDGSDVGVDGLVIDAIAANDNAGTLELLISFRVAGIVPGITGAPDGLELVDDSDIVLFTSTSLGDVTSGTFSFYFDGSDVGLDLNDEDIDAISLTRNGNLAISVNGAFTTGSIIAEDEDVLMFSSSSLGEQTVGNFSLLFDGSDVGLADGNNEDVDALSISTGRSMLISTRGDFAIDVLSGGGEDILKFSFTSIGDQTNGTFNLEYDLDMLGVAASADLGSIERVSAGLLP